MFSHRYEARKDINMKRKIITFIAVSLGLACIVLVVAKNVLSSGNKASISAKIDDYFLNKETLLDDTDLVIVGKVLSSSKIFLYKEVDFQTFDVEIFERLNTKESRKRITVIQTAFEGNSEFTLPRRSRFVYSVFAQ